MQATELITGNTIVTEPPAAESTGGQYVYREARWIALLIQGVLAIIGAGLGALAVLASVNAPAASSAVLVVGAASLICAAACLRLGNPINFVCTREGLYFPEISRFSRQHGRWLLVPWKNIREFRVQRMLDETSSRGVMLAISASPDEERAFFIGRAIFKLSALPRPADKKLVQIGFSTYLPRPNEVLSELRRYSAMQGQERNSGQLAIDRPA